jgi:hypothetical protein
MVNSESGLPPDPRLSTTPGEPADKSLLHSSFVVASQKAAYRGTKTFGCLVSEQVFRQSVLQGFALGMEVF